jgi:SAM-dependent methyltransferase
VTGSDQKRQSDTLRMHPRPRSTRICGNRRARACVAATAIGARRLGKRPQSSLRRAGSRARFLLWVPRLPFFRNSMQDADAESVFSPFEEVPATPLEALALEMAPWRTRLGRDDTLFDRYLPAKYRLTFAHFWTPLSVSAQVAKWLDDLGIDSVVDVGSGVGKFCVAAALASRSSFVGVEQRPELVRIARGIADLLGLGSRVTFRPGVLGETPMPRASCYYFFNPFAESLLQHPLDDTVDVSASRSLGDIFLAERFLRQAPAGTYVITYNGFGGTLPNRYEVLRRTSEFPCQLLLARKS